MKIFKLSFSEPNFNIKVKSAIVFGMIWTLMLCYIRVLQAINVARLILHCLLVHSKKALGLIPALGGADKFSLTVNWNQLVNEKQAWCEDPVMDGWPVQAVVLPLAPWRLGQTMNVNGRVRTCILSPWCCKCLLAASYGWGQFGSQTTTLQKCIWQMQ